MCMLTHNFHENSQSHTMNIYMMVSSCCFRRVVNRMRNNNSAIRILVRKRKDDPKAGGAGSEVMEAHKRFQEELVRSP